MCKKRNEVDRLFRRLKGYRRIFSRSDKLDVVFMFFIDFALISDTLVGVNRPQLVQLTVCILLLPQLDKQESVQGGDEGHGEAAPSVAKGEWHFRPL